MIAARRRRHGDGVATLVVFLTVIDVNDDGPAPKCADIL